MKRINSVHKKILFFISLSVFISGCNSLKPSTTTVEQEAAIKTGRSSVAYGRLETVCRLSEQDVIDVNNVIYHQYQLYFKGSPFYDYFLHGQKMAATSTRRDLEELLINEGGGSLQDGCEAVLNEVRELSIQLGR